MATENLFVPGLITSLFLHVDDASCARGSDDDDVCTPNLVPDATGNGGAVHANADAEPWKMHSSEIVNKDAMVGDGF